jgi:phage minor structural protein
MTIYIATITDGVLVQIYPRALPDVIECLVTEERNGGYWCDVRYPASGVNAEQITYGKSILVRYRGLAQWFDIEEITRDLDGIITFTAYHISYRLSRITIAPIAEASRTPAAAWTAMMNAVKGGSSTAFTFSTDLTTAKAWGVSGIYPNAKELLGGMEGSVLDTYGGVYSYDNFAVTLSSARGEDRNFVIKYGKNLTGFRMDIDTTAVYNYIVAYWSKDDLDGTTTYVDSGAVPISGSVLDSSVTKRCFALDLSAAYDEAPTAEVLRAAAVSYASANNLGQPKVSVNVSFVLISQTAENARHGWEYALEQVELDDTVHVKVPMYGVDVSVKVVKTVYDAILGRWDSITLDSQPKNVSRTIYELGKAAYSGGTLTMR